MYNLHQFLVIRILERIRSMRIRYPGKTDDEGAAIIAGV